MPIWKRSDNWLSGIGEDGHNPNHTITQLDGLTKQQAQSAFDKTYGIGTHTVSEHGTVLTVFSNRAMIRKMENGLERSQRANDQKMIAWYRDKIAEYRSRIEG